MAGVAPPLTQQLRLCSLHAVSVSSILPGSDCSNFSDTWSGGGLKLKSYPALRGTKMLVGISLFPAASLTDPAPKPTCPGNEPCVLGQGHVASLLRSDLRRSLFNASGCCDHPDLIIGSVPASAAVYKFK